VSALAKPATELRIAGSKLPEIPLPTNCPGCGVALGLEVMRKHNYVCSQCGHHFRLGADAWIALIADRRSWQERWGDVRSHDLLNWKVPKPYQEVVEQLMEDPQVKAIDAITTIKDEDLGPLKMQNVMFRLSESPGSIRFTGRRLGQDNEQVYGERLGLDPDRIAELRADGAI